MTRLRTRRLAGLFGVAFAALSATAPADDKLNVVASFSVLGDMVSEVGGERVSLTTLVGPNGDAHVYEPTPSDARAVSEADLVLINGLGFEGWIERLIESAGFEGRVLAVSEGIALLRSPEHHDDEADHPGAEEHHGEEGHEAEEEHHDADGEAHHEDEEHHHDHGEFDPHAWHDLSNGRRYVANISAALAEIDPDGSAHYGQRTAAYLARLEALDVAIRSQLSAVPLDRRKVIASHDAFRYFGHAYGVEFLAPVGLSTESEPSAQDMAELIRQMRAEDIRALFVDNISDPRLIEQLAREADGSLGGTLYSDSLSAADEPAASYLQMLEHNATVIAEALSR